MTDDSGGSDRHWSHADPTPTAAADLLALAETLAELPLDGAEPVLGAPRWR